MYIDRFHLKQINILFLRQMSEIQQPNQQIQFYLNTPWYEVVNCFNMKILVKELQLKEDQPRIFIGKCPFCGNLFYSKRTASFHFCQPQEENKIRMAMIYLIKWLCFKMIPLNAIEDPLFKSFCYILDPNLIIPPPAEMRSIIISFSDCLLNYQIKKARSKYFSILIDGKTQNDIHFISIILYSRTQYIYYITKKVCSENAVNISKILRECIDKLSFYNKTICSICSDNFSSNRCACKIKNLQKKIFRQYCNCHCANLAVSNLFDDGGKYNYVTQKILLALRLLKKLHPPKFTKVRWKSLSECATFIFKNKQKLVNIIENKYLDSTDVYSELKDFEWDEIKSALSIITEYIIGLESDEMRIEFVYGELTKTIQLLEKEETQIADDLATELINVYVSNDNLMVALSAFLLTTDGSFFWKDCSEEKKEFFFEYGYKGICDFCNKSGIEINDDMKDVFLDHLSNPNIQYCEPFIYWFSQNNSLSEVACRILTIPCSETTVERLFGGLTYMFDKKTNRMKTDLLNAKLRIRMYTVFDHIHEYSGRMLKRIKECYYFLRDHAFLNF